jgi:hypothetical protein
MVGLKQGLVVMLKVRHCRMLPIEIYRIVQDYKGGGFFG